MSAVIRKYFAGKPDGKNKEEILRAARANIAGAKQETAAYVAPPYRPEDPVRKWAREHSERAANRIVHSTRGHAVEQQQSADATNSWAEWVRTEIRAAVAAEHEFMIDIIGRTLGEERNRAGENLETKVKTLEAEIATLRGLLHEKVGGIAERAGKTHLELGQRLTTCERAMIGFKAQTDTLEQTLSDVRAYYRKLYGE
jgi:hypothetical protein